ncbi:calcium/sodium antiporter [Haloarchaeobius sp. HME9146]|uniref:calcium/sodium antiporter n=1 Tax=Haloarchaeobius sp. HME9146 TaxID=2978732 RepID=UPI0021C0BE2E|nr:calcium/sodium antiporter [Haloarchaeobius sp. HME9146]MCT9095525.1 calcium/sodium antiporter [Haloarchaeobius sp. HME9146]
MVSATLTDLVFIIAGAAGLWFGAVVLVESAVRIAWRLGIPTLVIGLTVVAFGTSAPEFVVTIDAALTGNADVSVANVVGSNVFNLGFVLGGVALAGALPVSYDLVQRDGSALLVAVIATTAFLVDGQLDRIEGSILFLGLLAYLSLLVTLSSRESMPAAVSEDDDLADVSGFELLDVPKLLVGLAAVVIGGHLLVDGAVGIARGLGISDWVIGATVVAAGTSAPEFATSLIAARRGSAGLSAGNLIGSSVFNLLGVLGLASVISPLSVGPEAYPSTLALFVLCLVVVALLTTEEELARWEGGLLVGVGAVNWIVGFLAG